MAEKIMDISTEGEHIVHPIDSRYKVKEMNSIWEEENYLQQMINVEVALAEAISEVKPELISKEEAADIRVNSKVGEKVQLKRVKAIEAEIHHDVMALVKGLAEQCSIGRGKIHVGATTADITETARAVLLKQSINLIIADAKKLLGVLVSRAKETRELVCIDRTHGQHAVPTTFGFILAGYADQIGKAIIRLEYDLQNHVVGKMAGAIGTANTFRELGLDGIELEQRVLKKLGVHAGVHSRQLPPRDNLMYLMADLTVLATALDKIASDLWNLGRTEIGEVQEATSSKQVGSSTMPHKKNPFRLERVIGMSSIIRGDLLTILESNFSHARDLRQSALDRYKLPEVFITLDYMLRMQANIIQYMIIDKEAIRANLYLTKGSVLAERVMMKLTEKGMDRQVAHERVKQLAWAAMREDKMLVDLLLQDGEISALLSEKQLRELMDPTNYIGYAVEKTDLVISTYKKWL